jgi:hypothetical protein
MTIKCPLFICTGEILPKLAQEEGAVLTRRNVLPSYKYIAGHGPPTSVFSYLDRSLNKLGDTSKLRKQVFLRHLILVFQLVEYAISGLAHASHRIRVLSVYLLSSIHRTHCL